MTGYTTIHAGSARQALTRLRFVCQLAAAVSLPLAALNTLVSESIDVVVHCARTPAGPRVTEVALVEDLAGGAEATHLSGAVNFDVDDLVPTEHRIEPVNGGVTKVPVQWHAHLTVRHHF